MFLGLMNESIFIWMKSYRITEIDGNESNDLRHTDTPSLDKPFFPTTNPTQTPYDKISKEKPTKDNIRQTISATISPKTPYDKLSKDKPSFPTTNPPKTTHDKPFPRQSHPRHPTADSPKTNPPSPRQTHQRQRTTNPFHDKPTKDTLRQTFPRETQPRHLTTNPLHDKTNHNDKPISHIVDRLDCLGVFLSLGLFVWDGFVGVP